jgi:2'-5' RNA ligase
MSSKRLFLALPLSRDWVKTIERYKDKNSDIPYLRWTPLENLHITALFLGDVDDAVLEDVRLRAGEVADDSKGIELSMERIQYGPPDSRARMVWAYLSPEAAYVDLVLELSRSMSEISAGLDDLKSRLLLDGADIIPHITLARFRSDMSYPRELHRLKMCEREGELFRADELVLFESRITLGKTEYRKIEVFKLGR